MAILRPGGRGTENAAAILSWGKGFFFFFLPFGSSLLYPRHSIAMRAWLRSRGQEPHDEIHEWRFIPAPEAVSRAEIHSGGGGTRSSRPCPSPKWPRVLLSAWQMAAASHSASRGVTSGRQLGGRPGSGSRSDASTWGGGRSDPPGEDGGARGGRGPGGGRSSRPEEGEALRPSPAGPALAEGRLRSRRAGRDPGGHLVRPPIPQPGLLLEASGDGAPPPHPQFPPASLSPAGRAAAALLGR